MGRKGRNFISNMTKLFLYYLSLLRVTIYQTSTNFSMHSFNIKLVITSIQYKTCHYFYSIHGKQYPRLNDSVPKWLNCSVAPWYRAWFLSFVFTINMVSSSVFNDHIKMHREKSLLSWYFLLFLLLTSWY